MKNKKTLIKLLALSEKPAHQRSYRLIEFYDCHMCKFRMILIPASEVFDTHKMHTKLIDEGFTLELTIKDFENICKKIQTPAKERVKLCERPGYVSINKKLCYVTHNGKALGKHDGISPMPYPESKAFDREKSKKGNLSGWQTLVASASLDSPYIMLAICSAFAGYCIFFY